MELVTATVKVLLLSTLLDNFRENGKDTEDSKEVLDFFREEYNSAIQSFVKVSVVIDVLADIGWADSDNDNDNMKILFNILEELEQTSPGAYIDVGS